MTLITLEDGSSAELNRESNVMIGTYAEVLTGDMTARVYIAGLRFVHEIGVENLRGIIFDFRKVQRFSRDNLPAAQSESYRANRNLSLDHVPIAMVVETPIQEQMVRISMQSTPGQNRKRIVHTIEEGYAFIDAFNQQSEEEDKP